MSNEILDITAVITGVGDQSTVEDNPDAVDADIYCNSEKIGSVTLLPDSNGDLSTWGGCASHWADQALLDWRECSDDSIDMDIEAAVQDAAETSD